MAPSMRHLAAVPLAALSFALANPALADEICDPLHTTCTVPDPVASGQGTVATTVDTVTGTAKPIVEDPQGTIDRIVNPGGSVPPGDGGGGGGGRGGGGGGGGQPAVHHPTVGSSHAARGSQIPRPAGPRSSGSHSGGSSIGRSTIVAPPSKDPVFADQVAGAVHVVARSLVVVLALLAVAVGFVVIQNRLDRSDPKLALAPVQTEMMGFS